MSKIKFETQPPVEIKTQITSTKNLMLKFLYGGPVIPAGAQFDIIDNIMPGDEWLPASITLHSENCDEVFLVDISNVPFGFYTLMQWQEEDEKGEDLSDIISIPVHWWKNNLMTEKECAELTGIEVFHFGEEVRARQEAKSRNALISGYLYEEDLPLDLVNAVEKISTGTDMYLQQAIKYLMRERGWYHYFEEVKDEIVLITDTNLIITKKEKDDGFMPYELWHLTNNYMEKNGCFPTLEAVKKYLFKWAAEN